MAVLQSFRIICWTPQRPKVSEQMGTFGARSLWPSGRPILQFKGFEFAALADLRVTLVFTGTIPRSCGFNLSVVVARPCKVIHRVFDFGFRSLTGCLIAAAIGFSVLPTGSLSGQTTDSKSADDRWLQQGWPLVEQFCVDCHNQDNQEAELDLSTLGDLTTLPATAGSMKRIMEMVRFGAMPPDDADQPSDQQRRSLVEALDNKLYANSCDLRPRPGKVTARRLNRAEYNHSIRDLFGIDVQPAADFPSDEVGAGFDNNGDVLSLSPILMEKYLEAAEKIAGRLIVDPTTWPKIEQTIAAEDLYVSGDAKMDSANGWFVAPDTFVWLDIEVPASGTYALSIRGGKASYDDSPMNVAVYDETGKLLDMHRFKYFGGERKSSRSERKIELSKGKRRLFFEPVEQETELEVGKTVSPQYANLDDQTAAAAAARRGEPHEKQTRIDPDDYPFLFRQITLRGPSSHSSEAFPETHNRIVVSVPRQRKGHWIDVPQAATKCLQPVIRRAFRGGASEADVQRYVDLVSTVTDRGGSYYRGLQVAITGILVSPRFLFRLETPPADARRQDNGSVQLTQFQLATRLSYFLWSSLPDEALLRDAEDNKLHGDVIEAHVRRMLQDPRSDALATQFAAQWLGLRNLEQHEADTTQFDSFTPSLRAAMKRETESLFMHMVRQNRPIREMLTSDFTFVNAELAAHYGIDGVDGDELQQVSLASLPRRGVLSHASVLTLTSNPQRTSPVKRGKWILENILGTPPPDPPPGVPELEATKTAEEHASFREQLELHRASPTCASCHRVMDQLGFGLEQFDPIGGFRESERGKPVDASGELPGGRSFDGAVELTEILAEHESEGFAGVVVERLMTFALGREMSPGDRCTVAEIVKETAENNYRWIDLILEVVRSDQFQYYDTEVSSVN